MWKHDNPIGAPLTLQRKLARDASRNYFITGSFDRSYEKYLFTCIPVVNVLVVVPDNEFVVTSKR